MLRGVDQLIVERKRRSRSYLPLVLLDADGGWPSWWYRGWAVDDVAVARVQCDPTDVAAQLDWRPFIGLPVQVTSTDRDRLLSFAMELYAAKASRICAVWMSSPTNPYEYPQPLEIMDSQTGGFTWPK